jgi:hypothetical protein
MEQLNTPVLFLIFNRPETTKQVFEAIRKAKPRQLFVAADGPRENKPNENKLCEEARKIATAVDWDCKVTTLFRDANMGCGPGVSGAISWFFQQVEQGIILEDDCLPAPSFFPFSEQLLQRFEKNEEIQMISGANLLEGWQDCEESYFFSRKGGMWGWSTWRRAWSKYDYFSEQLKKDRVRELFFQNIGNPGERKVYWNALKKLLDDPATFTTWDYQWVFTRIFYNQVTIVPKENMIRNLGFGSDATHTLDPGARLAKLKVSETVFPLVHPDGRMVEQKYDDIHSETFYPDKKSSFLKNIFSNK